MCFCFQYLLVNKVCQMTGLVGLKGRTWHGFQMNAVLFLLWGTSLVPYLLKHKKATLIPTVPWSPGITIWVSESQISGSRLSFPCKHRVFPAPRAKPPFPDGSVLNSMSVEVGTQQAEFPPSPCVLPSPESVSRLHCLDFGLWVLSSSSRADQAGQAEGAVIFKGLGLESELAQHCSPWDFWLQLFTTISAWCSLTLRSSPSSARSPSLQRDSQLDLLPTLVTSPLWIWQSYG